MRPPAALGGRRLHGWHGPSGSLAGRPGHTGHLFNAWIYDARDRESPRSPAWRRRSAPSRPGPPWAMLGSGLARVGGSPISSPTPMRAYDEARSDGSPGSTLFFLAALPCLFAGVALLTRSRLGRFPVAGWFDALAAGLAIDGTWRSPSPPRRSSTTDPSSTVDRDHQHRLSVRRPADARLPRRVAADPRRPRLPGDAARRRRASSSGPRPTSHSRSGSPTGTYRGGILDVALARSAPS